MISVRQRTWSHCEQFNETRQNYFCTRPRVARGHHRVARRAEPALAGEEGSRRRGPDAVRRGLSPGDVPPHLPGHGFHQQEYRRRARKWFYRVSSTDGQCGQTAWRTEIIFRHRSHAGKTSGSRKWKSVICDIFKLRPCRWLWSGRKTTTLRPSKDSAISCCSGKKPGRCGRRRSEFSAHFMCFRNRSVTASQWMTL